MPYLIWVKSYCRKNRKKTAILEILLSWGQTVDLRSSLRTHWRKSVKRASYRMRFWGRCSSSGSRVMWRFVEKCWKRQNLTFGDLWWSDLWPDLKNDWTSFFMIFGALSNTAYRVTSQSFLPDTEINVGNVLSFICLGPTAFSFKFSRNHFQWTDSQG